MAAITQQRPPGLFSGRRYGSFSGKTSSATSGPHPVGILTQQRSPGIFAGRRYGSFAGKAATVTSDWDLAPPFYLPMTGTLTASLPSGLVYFVPATPLPPSALDIYTVKRVELNPKPLTTDLSLRIDFISKLPQGVTLIACTTYAVVFSGTDLSPASIIQGSTVISGSVVRQTITGGVAGVLYGLLFSAVGSDGEDYQLLGVLPVLAS